MNILKTFQAKKGEIHDDSEKQSGTDWVLPKNIELGIGYLSDTGGHPLGSPGK